MNKKILLITMILFLLISPIISEAKTIKVKINGNGQTIITKDFNGLKLTVKTPKINKNKYLKMINIGI